VIQVEVTQEEIANGIVGDPDACPVVLAIKRTFQGELKPPLELEVSADRKDIEVNGHVIATPESVAEFIGNFDNLPQLAENEDDSPNYRPDPTSEEFAALQPFSFPLPDFSDPSWKERCNKCGDIFYRTDLDDEGYCEECRGDDETEEDGEQS
jgi:hypothetical protein